jgi:hypothetical protein
MTKITALLVVIGPVLWALSVDVPGFLHVGAIVLGAAIGLAVASIDTVPYK